MLSVIDNIITFFCYYVIRYRGKQNRGFACAAALLGNLRSGRLCGPLRGVFKKWGLVLAGL